MEKKLYDNCVEILKEELIAAMGCTEPIRRSPLCPHWHARRWEVSLYPARSCAAATL